MSTPAKSYMIDPPDFRYTIDRQVEFKKRWHPWLVVAVIVAFVLCVIPINTAFQAYQTVSVYEVNWNATKTHWFNFLWPEPKPGQMCDPHILSLGDTFVTDTGGLVWTLNAANSQRNGDIQANSLNASTTRSTGQYAGTSLDWCDVNTIQVYADTSAWKVQLSAAVMCYKTDDFLIVDTVVAEGVHDNEWFHERVSGINLDTAWLQTLLSDAGVDLLGQMNAMGTLPGVTPITRVSVTVLPDQCPKAFLENQETFLSSTYPYLVQPRSWCNPSDTSSPPNLNANWDVSQTWPNNATASQSFLYNAINNSMQALVAAVRFDLGNRMPNNFITNTSAASQAIAPPFTGITPAPNSQLLQWIEQNPITGASASLTASETPTFVVPYLCKVSILKNTGSAIISVLVATLTFFNNGWTVLLFALAWWYKNRKENKDLANYCEGHRNRDVEQGIGSPVSLQSPETTRRETNFTIRTAVDDASTKGMPERSA